MTAVIPGNSARTSSTSPRSRRGRPARPSSPSCSRPRSRRGSTPTRPTTPRRPFTCTTGPWCAADYAAGKPWTVTTFDHTYAGSISITNATLRSDNTVYAQLTLDVGPDTVWRMARRLGVNLAGQKPVASIGLGSLSVSPLDMAAAYATFASGGDLREADRDPQGGLPERQGRHERRLGEAADEARARRRASPGRSTRSSARTRSTGRARARATASTRTPARRAPPRTSPTPGSTATRATSRPSSGWATRRARSRCSTCTGGRSPGATFPVPIWHLFMAAAEKGTPARQFLTPDPQPVYKPFTQGYWGYLAVPHHDDHHDDEPAKPQAARPRSSRAIALVH